MSICHPLNNTMCSPKASRNTTVLILPPLAVFEGNGRPESFSVAYCMYKGPVDPRRLNPAALDAHPADVMIFTSLASSHQAQLRSPRLNELSSPAAAGRVSSLFSYKRLFLQIKNKIDHNPISSFIRSKISASFVLILRSWTVTTTMSASATFTTVTPLSSELRVKLKHYQKTVCVPFKIQAPTYKSVINEGACLHNYVFMYVFDYNIDFSHIAILPSFTLC